VKRVNLSKAKAHLGRYVREVQAGETVILAERNIPVAELRALPTSGIGVKISVGVMDGMVEIPDDFDEPLPEFERDFYGLKS
jgi:antitoxin (DNA-binding transcriptional repressor) of toxin-antitoxin stability system